MVRQSNIEVVIPSKRVAKMPRTPEKPAVNASPTPRRSARLASSKQDVQPHKRRVAPTNTRRVGAADLSDEIIEQILLGCVEIIPFNYAIINCGSDTYDRDSLPWAYDGVDEKDNLAPWMAVKSHKLCQLSLVSKRFKRMADYILYRYVTIYIPGASSLRNNPGAYVLLNLLSQPDYARHVESLHFLYPKSIVPGGASENVNRTLTKLNSIFGKDTKTVPALAEVIAACPNLRNLRIDVCHMDLAAAKDVGIAISGLQHLDKLHLHITSRAELPAGAIIAQLVPRHRKLSSLFLVFQTLTGSRPDPDQQGHSTRDIETKEILSGVQTERLVLAPLIKPRFIDDFELKFMLFGMAAVPKSLEVQGHYFSAGLGDYLEQNGRQISRLSLDHFDSSWQPAIPVNSMAICQNLVTLHLVSSPFIAALLASSPHIYLQKLSLTWWHRHIDLFTPLYSWLSTNNPAQLLQIKITPELTGLRHGTSADNLRTLNQAKEAARECDEWCVKRGILQKPASFEELVREEIDYMLHQPLTGQLLQNLLQAPLGDSYQIQEIQEGDIQESEEDGEEDDQDLGGSDTSDMASEDTLLLVED